MKLSEDQKTKNEISSISRKILAQKEDTIIGLRKIYSLLSEANLTDDEFYGLVSAIVDETELIPKGKIRLNFSESYLEEQDVFEKGYLAENKTVIEEMLENFSKIPIIEPIEDPYTWPFEGYK
jgi:hypothetical protein